MMDKAKMEAKLTLINEKVKYSSMGNHRRDFHAGSGDQGRESASGQGTSQNPTTLQVHSHSPSLNCYN